MTETVRSSERRDYIRKFQRAWVRRRRAAWIAANGPCAQCGSSDRLEVDHRDPTEKEIPTSALWGMSPRNPKRIAELAKCQVLCHGCHKQKTTREAGKMVRTFTLHKRVPHASLELLQFRMRQENELLPRRGRPRKIAV